MQENNMNDITSSPATVTETSTPKVVPTPSSSITNTNDNKAKLVIPPNRKDVRKLFVGGLSREVNDKNFAAFFAKYGVILDSVVMVDRFTKIPRGFGFVTFEDPAVAMKLLADVNNHDVNGRSKGRGKINIYGKMCEIKASEPKKPYPNGNGGGTSRGRNSVQSQNGMSSAINDQSRSGGGTIACTGTGASSNRLDSSGHPGQSVCSSSESSEARIPEQIQFQNGGGGMAKNHGGIDETGTNLDVGNKAPEIEPTAMGGHHWNSNCLPPPQHFYPMPMQGVPVPVPGGYPMNMNVSPDFMYHAPNVVYDYQNPYAYYPPPNGMMPVYPPQYYHGYGYPAIPSNVQVNQGMMTNTPNGVVKTSHEKGTAISSQGN